MTPEPRRRHTAALIAGCAVGLVSLLLLGTGAAALWLDDEKDDRGYLAGDAGRVTTTTRALTSDNLDLDVGATGSVGGDALGKLRLDVDPRGDAPVFAGVARTSDADAYLRGSAHAVVRDVELDPFRADVEERPGDGALAAPAGADIWAASTQGSGARSLTWDVEDGDWTLVVMNADGSPGVDADIGAGITLPYLDDAGWALLGGGLLAGIGAVALFVLAGARRPGQRPDEPNPAAPRSVAPSASTT